MLCTIFPLSLHLTAHFPSQYLISHPRHWVISSHLFPLLYICHPLTLFPSFRCFPSEDASHGHLSTVWIHPSITAWISTQPSFATFPNFICFMIGFSLCFLCSSPPPMVRIVTVGENAVITYINISNLNMPTSQTHSALATAAVLSTVFPLLESRFLSAISASTFLLIWFFIPPFQNQPSAFFHWNLKCHRYCQYVDGCETFFMCIRCKLNGSAECYLL